MSLVEAKLALGAPAEAAPLARRALAIVDAGESEPRVRAELYFTAARAIWRADGAVDEARRLAERARAAYRESERSSDDEVAAIDRWLADLH